MAAPVARPVGHPPSGTGFAICATAGPLPASAAVSCGWRATTSAIPNPLGGGVGEARIDYGPDLSPVLHAPRRGGLSAAARWRQKHVALMSAATCGYGVSRREADRGYRCVHRAT